MVDQLGFVSAEGCNSAAWSAVQEEKISLEIFEEARRSGVTTDVVNALP